MIEGLTYADVLIQPGISDIDTRTEIEIDTNFLGIDILPFISSPMDYVTGYTMAKRLFEIGSFGVVSRFGYIEDQIEGDFDYAKAVGVKDGADDALTTIESEEPYAICIDVAHGHHTRVAEVIDAVKQERPDVKIIAGNVATSAGFRFLEAAGADAIRVGIGSGSACSTRENTGVGVPQLTAIMECASVAKTAHLIADGGIQTPGDIVKALAAGADVVMLGQWLAGHSEAPGEMTSFGGLHYKPYRGQSLLGSNGARKAPEGVEGWVPYKGPVEDTIISLSNYLRSGMSYVGARDLTELRNNVTFIKVSPGTHNESRTRLGDIN